MVLASQELAGAERRVDPRLLVFEHLAEPTLLLDPQADQIVDANPAACSLLGYDRALLRGTKISALHTDQMPALIVFAETICAALVALGLWTRLSTVPLIIGLGVVVFVSTSGLAFAEKELALCYLVAFTTIFFTGSGRFSLDRLTFQ